VLARVFSVDGGPRRAASPPAAPAQTPQAWSGSGLPAIPETRNRDPAGSPTATIDTRWKQVTPTCDQMDRKETVTDPGSEFWAFDWDGLRRLEDHVDARENRIRSECDLPAEDASGQG